MNSADAPSSPLPAPNSRSAEAAAATGESQKMHMEIDVQGTNGTSQDLVSGMMKIVPSDVDVSSMIKKSCFVCAS